MLGRLARYLRLLGYDVEYPPPGPDSGLIARARSEGRVLLTRDREIIDRVGGGAPEVVEIASEAVLDQVEQLRAEGWLTARMPPRCGECNAPLECMPRWEAMHLVPPFVLAVQVRYAWCGNCNIVLWEGTHWEYFHSAVYAKAGGLTPPENGE
ncbi:MAG: hypothetical protein HPY75_01410 [Actinobacteria bacterium]|nr:hypothetical protein [Actinomycetota bacterium]